MKPFKIRKILHLDDLGGSDPELVNVVEVFSEYLDDLGTEVSLKMDESATFLATALGRPVTKLKLRVHEFFFGEGTVSYLLIGSGSPETKHLETLVNSGVYLQPVTMVP